MITKLKARVGRLEKDFRARRLLDEGLRMFDADLYDRLKAELAATMPSVHWLAVIDDLIRKDKHDELLRLANREDRFRLRPPRRTFVPRLCFSRLTVSFISRLERALRGDRRPLALPGKVCDIYLWMERYKRDDIPLRECEACGYDTPAPPPVTYYAALNVLAGCSHIRESFSTFALDSCPLCGDRLAPNGTSLWRAENSDKVIDLHVWPDGEVSALD